MFRDELVDRSKGRAGTLRFRLKEKNAVLYVCSAASLLLYRRILFLFQLCESPPSEQDKPNTIYSAPVSELGSTANLNKLTTTQTTTTIAGGGGSTAAAASASVPNEEIGSNNSCKLEASNNNTTATASSSAHTHPKKKASTSNNAEVGN